MNRLLVCILLLGVTMLVDGISMKTSMHIFLSSIVAFYLLFAL